MPAARCQMASRYLRLRFLFSFRFPDFQIVPEPPITRADSPPHPLTPFFRGLTQVPSVGPSSPNEAGAPAVAAVPVQTSADSPASTATTAEAGPGHLPPAPTQSEVPVSAPTAMASSHTPAAAAPVAVAETGAGFDAAHTTAQAVSQPQQQPEYTVPASVPVAGPPPAQQAHAQGPPPSSGSPFTFGGAASSRQQELHASPPDFFSQAPGGMGMGMGGAFAQQSHHGEGFPSQAPAPPAPQWGGSVFSNPVPQQQQPQQQYTQHNTAPAHSAAVPATPAHTQQEGYGAPPVPPQPAAMSHPAAAAPMPHQAAHAPAVSAPQPSHDQVSCVPKPERLLMSVLRNISSVLQHGS